MVDVDEGVRPAVRQPPRGRVDVPLNSRIEIVFSEPIAERSVSTTSIKLLRGNTPVDGAVHLVQGVAAAAVFEPTGSLAPQSDYQIVVTEEVTDLEGASLDSSVTVPFRTGSRLEGSMFDLSMTVVGRRS